MTKTQEILKTERTPTAILISDIHYSLATMSLADMALRAAIDMAAALKVPLIVAGDLHDTKAILRGECIKVILDTYDYAFSIGVSTFTLIGNHDKLNEKGDGHALEFLRGATELVERPISVGPLHFIPYQSNPEDFTRVLGSIPKGSTVIMHQGVTEAEKGEYVYDKSAINKEILSDYRVISGHYHKAQDIKCGRPRAGAVGLMSYIGSPYTITFAEANDGPKGFQILFDDGLLEQLPLTLRKHIIITAAISPEEMLFRTTAEGNPGYGRNPTPINSGDLIWVKLSGPYLALDKVKKSDVAALIGINHNSFKLDKIVTDAPELEAKQVEKKSGGEILDMLIEASEESAAKKMELKALWRGLV